LGFVPVAVHFEIFQTLVKLGRPVTPSEVVEAVAKNEYVKSPLSSSQRIERWDLKADLEGLRSSSGWYKLQFLIFYSFCSLILDRGYIVHHGWTWTLGFGRRQVSTECHNKTYGSTSVGHPWSITLVRASFASYPTF
jgi:hypothetical protein